MSIATYYLITMMQFRRPLNISAQLPALKVGAVVLALLLLAVFTPGMPPVVRNVAHQGAAPLWQMRDTAVGAVYGAVAILETREELVARNTELYAEISDMRRQTFETTVLRAENRRLRELLGRTDGNTATAASVLSRPAWSPYDTLIIDAGSDEGITKHALVLVDGEVAIGFVAEVYDTTSSVVLFSAPGQETPVIIGTGSTTPALARGYGGGNFTVELPRDANIALYDPVVLPTLTPRVFAIVESIERDPTDSFQIVRFRAPVNYATMRVVTVADDRHFVETLHASTTDTAQ
jgi:cell shape-determining protein MreC